MNKELETLKNSTIQGVGFTIGALLVYALLGALVIKSVSK